MEFGGAERDRTDDLMLAKHALSQLSYSPQSLEGEQALACFAWTNSRFANKLSPASPVSLVPNFWRTGSRLLR